MVVFAAQIDERLRGELERLASLPRSFAEINREIGLRAASLGLVKPSYARVRQIVIEAREAIRDDAHEPSWGELLLDVDLRRRSPMAIIDKLDGVPVRLDGVASRTRHPPSS